MNNTVSETSFTGEASLAFRALFYLVLPSESSFPNIETVPKYVDKAIPAFVLMVLVEAALGRMHEKTSTSPFRFNDAMSSIGAGLLSLLPLVLFRNIELTAYTYVWNNLRIFELPWESPWTWMLSMLGVDLGYYWVHRCAHEINFMWAAHQVHHSSEDYNLSTALRQSVLQRYASWVFYLPMAFFVPPQVFLVHVQFNLLYQFWIHTGIVNRLGPLEWVLNTASHHRVHHGRNRYCIDKNYAGVLIIWDRMFGTFVPEGKTEDIAYGLVHPVNSWDPIYIQTCHWQYLLNKARSTPGFWNKLWVFLKGPGWDIGKPRLGYLTDIPDIKAPQKKYDKDVSHLMHLYTWIHFLAAVVGYVILSKAKDDISFFAALLGCLFILWTLTNLGYLYEHKRYTHILELVRCCAYLAGDAALCFGSTCHPALLVPRTIFMLSAGGWLVSMATSTKTKQQ